MCESSAIGWQRPTQPWSLGELLSAAEAGDQETLSAILGAHPNAYPQISRMLAANPQIVAEARRTIRYKDDPVMLGVAQDRSTLAAGLSAIVGDLRTAAGTPDALTQQAGAA